MPSDETNNRTRAALYARVSTDLQSADSIEDQLRICAERAVNEGWQVVESYVDQAISGASLIRPGIQKLLQYADARKFDIILTESLDRVSRDQEDIAHIYKRMRFKGVRMVTLSESEVNELHIGLKGTMGALYLKERAIVSIALRPSRAQALYRQLTWGLCIDPAGRRIYRLT